MRFIIFLTFILNGYHQFCQAQYAPSVNQPGTTAMYKDSLAFVAWATSCSVVRGYKNIAEPDSGYASAGDENMGIGKAGENPTVSLGDGGYAILQFNVPIKDEPGFDFAVFENAFDDQFLELAFVEVSSDGIHYFRFPAVSETDTIIQTGPFDYTTASKLNNLAGKYRMFYGTPFDLNDIPENSLLNKEAITYVKIIDVIGCIENQYASRDINHHKVNDPWPTPYPSSGFDLDAVGVIHQQSTGIAETLENSIQAYPNPFNHEIFISNKNQEIYSLTIYNINGEPIYQADSLEKSIDINTFLWNQGVYMLSVKTKRGIFQKKIIKF